jgi:hypothetical protein
MHALAILLISSITAFAGGFSEGGGKGVVCKDANGTVASVASLDLFESEQIRGLTFDDSLLGADEFATVANIIARIEARDPYLAGILTERLTAWLTESRLLPNSHLPDVNDSFSVVIPVGCELAQLAVQREPQFPGDPFYLIDKSLWDVMANRDRAALVLHEIIYRYARTLGQMNSINVRFYNATMSSTSAAAISGLEYVKFLETVDFPDTLLVPLENGTSFIIKLKEGWEESELCPNSTELMDPSYGEMKTANVAIKDHVGMGHGAQVYIKDPRSDQSDSRVLGIQNSTGEPLTPDLGYYAWCKVKNSSEPRALSAIDLK